MYIRRALGRSNPRRRDDIPRQSEHGEQADGEVGDVQFPPLMTMPGRSRIGMMVIVPAFSVADQTDEKVVPAMVVRRIGTIAPQVSDRVYRPSDVPNQHRAHNHPPKEQARSEAQSFP